MNYYILRVSASNSIKCFLYNMFSRLCKHLYSNIIRNQIFLNKLTAEFIFCLACSRKSYLYFFKSNSDKFLIELDFLIKAHRNYKRLVTISKVNTAPDRSLIYIFFLYPLSTFYRWHKITSFVMLIIFHDNYLQLIYFTIFYYNNQGLRDPTVLS